MSVFEEEEITTEFEEDLRDEVENEAKGKTSSSVPSTDEKKFEKESEELETFAGIATEAKKKFMDFLRSCCNFSESDHFGSLVSVYIHLKQDVLSTFRLTHEIIDISEEMVKIILECKEDLRNLPWGDRSEYFIRKREQKYPNEHPIKDEFEKMKLVPSTSDESLEKKIEDSSDLKLFKGRMISQTLMELIIEFDKKNNRDQADDEKPDENPSSSAPSAGEQKAKKFEKDLEELQAFVVICDETKKQILHFLESNHTLTKTNHLGFKVANYIHSESDHFNVFIRAYKIIDDSSYVARDHLKYKEKIRNMSQSEKLEFFAEIQK